MQKSEAYLFSGPFSFLQKKNAPTLAKMTLCFELSFFFCADEFISIASI